MMRPSMRPSRKVRRHLDFQLLERRSMLDAAEMEVVNLADQSLDGELDSMAADASVMTMLAMGETEAEVRQLDISEEFDESLMFANAMSESDQEVTLETPSSLETLSGSENEIIAFNGTSQLPQLDVDGNGRISPLDVILIINAIHNDAESQADMLTALDVNRDSRITPLDALMVLNQINRMEEFSWFMIDDPSERIMNSELADGMIVPDDELMADDVPTSFVAEAARIRWSDEDKAAEETLSQEVTEETSASLLEFSKLVTEIQSDDASRIDISE
ncbi:MAG: dockerin type I domain-containing protein [Pirellula sp.]